MLGKAVQGLTREMTVSPCSSEFLLKMDKSCQEEGSAEVLPLEIRTSTEFRVA